MKNIRTENEHLKKHNRELHRRLQQKESPLQSQRVKEKKIIMLRKGSSVEIRASRSFGYEKAGGSSPSPSTNHAVDCSQPLIHISKLKIGYMEKRQLMRARLKVHVFNSRFDSYFRHHILSAGSSLGYRKLFQVSDHSLIQLGISRALRNGKQGNTIKLIVSKLLEILGGVVGSNPAPRTIARIAKRNILLVRNKLIKYLGLRLEKLEISPITYTAGSFPDTGTKIGERL